MSLDQVHAKQSERNTQDLSKHWQSFRKDTDPYNYHTRGGRRGGTAPSFR